jgi:asparagine synthase (glutamine-hydrolysing)
VLAFARSWGDCGHHNAQDADRLAASLCSGIGGTATAVTLDGQHFAYRPLAGSAPGWRPAQLTGGRLLAFHGHIDNPDEVAAELGLDPADPAKLYGHALEVWGDEADRRIIGEYCTIVTGQSPGLVRLARSPLRAPPLIYHHGETLVAAASVPRAVFAAGVEQHFSETRIADSAMINFTDLEASWFEGLARVPLGSIVELEQNRPRQLRTYYDLARAASAPAVSPDAHVARVRELLDQAVRAATRGFERPGATLSGGLDSPQVAVRAAANLPPGQKLPTFTFHPEPGWDGVTGTGFNGDERPMVEAFAANHPSIDPHFTSNAGQGHDHRWNDMFMLMGGAPSGLCNMYVFHGIWSLAREHRCDLLLLAEWGNFTFSDKGDWGFVEYFLTGRWRQLWKALKDNPHDDRSMLRRFVALCLVPLLPNRAWRWLMRVWHPDEQLRHDIMVPLRAGYRKSSGANQRMSATGFQFGRYQPRSRKHARELLFANLDGDSAEVYQAFEQLYGVPCRDPLAYRPLVEYCFALPTEMFLRDGQMRWLAKELAKGIMPEEQRRNRLNGRWDADWHLRIKRRRADYLEELDLIEADPDLAAMLDVPRLRQALLDFPAATSTDPQVYFPIEFTLMRGLLTARFIRWAEGRN